MQMEFEQLKKIFQDQIRLSPFDPEKEINILTDGASSKGIGFVFHQNANENKPGEDITIVQVNSCALKDSQLSYVYSAPQVNIYTDCIALQGLFGKPLSEIKNKRIHNMIEQLMYWGEEEKLRIA